MRKFMDHGLKTEVLVIGSGFAGLCAAIEAKNSGADVIVCEKMKAVGGNSIISDGGIAAPETELQKTYGIIDSKELMVQDMMKSGLGFNDKELVRVLVERSKSAFDWSVQYLKVPYVNRVDQFGGHSVARCYTAENTTGATIIKKLVQKMDELEIPIKKQMLFKTFVLDSSGKVCGGIFREGYDIHAPQKGNDVYIEATKGVIIATGGFGADVAFRKKQDSRLTEQIDTTNKLCATSEALVEAMRIGADTVDLNFIQLGPWASPDEKGYGVGPMFSEYIVFQYGMIVDPLTGKRFVNELADRKVLSDKLLSIGHPCIGIADDLAVRSSGWDIRKSMDRGVVLAFDSIEELAAHYHISKEVLLETVKVFNADVTAGKDDIFQKPIIKGASMIENAPFYAMRLWPKVHYTMGGIKITPACEVLDRDGNVIPGLFAAGEVTGGIHGANRLGSCSITECMVFGRIAGKKASKNNLNVGI